MQVTNTPARSMVAVPLAALLVLLAIPRVYAIVTSVAPAHDAIRYWAAAKCFDDLPYRFAIHWIDCQPLYPLTLSWLGLGWNSANDPEWIWRVSQVWSSVCHLTFLASLFLLGSRLSPIPIAWLGCFAVGMLPRSIRYSVDVLPDNLHVALWGMAFLLMGYSFPVDARASHPARTAISLCMLGAASGLTSGLAYWVRIEGALCSIVIVLAWLSASFFRRDSSMIRTSLLFLIPFCTTSLFVILTYVELRGQLAPRNTAHAMMGLASREERTAATLDLAILASGATAPVEPRTPIDAWIESSGNGLSHQILGAAGRAGWEWMQETRVWLALLSILGISAAWPYRRSPIVWLALFSILACLALGFMVRWRAGYLAGRYLLPSLVGVAILAPLGVERIRTLIATIPIPQNFSTHRRWLAGAAMIAIAILSSISAWTKPLHRDHAGYRAASEWIAQHSRPSDRVFDPTWQTSFFADRENWRPTNDDMVSARYAVIDPSIAARPPLGIARSLNDVARRGRLVAEFPKHASSEEIGVRVYEMPTPSLMGN